MGAKEKDVGGGPAVGLANDWTKALGGMIGGQNYSTQVRPNIGPGMQAPGDMSAKDAFGTGFQQGSQDNMGRAPQGGVTGTVNKFLSGDFGPSNYGVDTSGLKGMANQPGFDFGQFNPQTTDFSQFNTGALKGFQPGVGQGAFSSANPMADPQFQALLSKLTGSNANAGLQAPGQTSFQLGPVDVSAYKGLWDRNRAQTLADTRARFGAEGGASFGTPAAFAEANAMGEFGAQEAASMADIGRQQQALKLQADIAGGNINAENMRAYNELIGRGNIAGASAAGTGLDAILKSQGLTQEGGLTARGQDLQGQIASGQMSLDAISKATGLDLEQLQSMSKQGIDVQSLLNQRQGMQAGNQVDTGRNNIDALSKALGIDLSGNELNQRDALAKLGLTGDMANNVMAMIQQMSGKGVSQRQTVMQPSTFQNVLGAATGLAGAAGGFMTGLGPVLKAAGSATGNVNQNPLNMAEGGTVPGQGDKDTTPAMLTPGETIIKKNISRQLGPFAQMLNDLKTPKQIARVRRAIADATGTRVDEDIETEDQQEVYKKANIGQNLADALMRSDMPWQFRMDLRDIGNKNTSADTTGVQQLQAALRSKYGDKTKDYNLPTDRFLEQKLEELRSRSPGTLPGESGQWLRDAMGVEHGANPLGIDPYSGAAAGGSGGALESILQTMKAIR